MSRLPSQLPGGRHGLPRSFVVRNQRERILAAVADTVAERGYAAMTVEDVVRLSGVSRRTFYDQFADKRAAFFAAYDAATEQTMVATAEAFLSSTYWPEQVRLGLQAFLGFLANDFAITRMGFMEIPLAGPEGEARHLAGRTGFEVFLAPGEAMAAHPIPPMVPKVVGGGIFELAYAHVVRGRTDELPGLLPTCVYHCLAPYVGLEMAAREAELAKRSLGS
ncbi:MAG TPA: TetR/AcrR family transcriptional regulator [Solirubrobacteraceae bacterium]|nr:TetR/AcrR family transcriptional regulator [Solirubrobacteraceae bacterium]